jgi:hypothetical protein
MRQAVRWLLDRGELPSRLGERPEAWAPVVFRDLAEWVERRAGLIVFSVDPEGAPRRTRGELAAERLVRIVNELRVVKHMPEGAVVRMPATDATKRRARFIFDRWWAEMDRLSEDALNLSDTLLEVAGPGIGTGIREWVKRLDTSYGQEFDPFDDEVLSTVVHEAEAIARIARLAAPACGVEPPASAAAAAAEHPSRGSATSGTKRRGRLTKQVSEAKRAHFLATIRAHHTLVDDVPHLAWMFDLSQSTVRRWIEAERCKYVQSQAARRPGSAAADEDDDRP